MIYFRADKKKLQSGLKRIKALASKKSVLDFATHVLLEKTGNSLLLATTNLELYANFVIDVETVEHSVGNANSVDSTIDGADFCVAVPMKALADSVEAASKAEATVAFQLSDHQAALYVFTERATTTLATIPADQFPCVPTREDCGTYKLNTVSEDALLFECLGSDLTRIAQAVAMFAMSDDRFDRRIQLEQVLFKRQDDRPELLTVASDGYRIARLRTNVESIANEPFEFLIPAKSYSFVTRLLAGSKDRVKVYRYTHEGFIFFECGGVEFVVRTPDLQYPAYERMYQKDYVTTFQLRVFDWISILSSLSTQFLVLTCMPENKMRITCDEDKSIDVTLHALHSNYEKPFAITRKYLLEALKAFSGDVITIQLAEQYWESAQAHRSDQVYITSDKDEYDHLLKLINRR